MATQLQSLFTDCHRFNDYCLYFEALNVEEGSNRKSDRPYKFESSFSTWTVKYSEFFVRQCQYHQDHRPVGA